MEVAVQLVTEVTYEIVAAFCRVEPELSSRPRPVAPAELDWMASCEVYRLLVGRVDHLPWASRRPPGSPAPLVTHLLGT